MIGDWTFKQAPDLVSSEEPETRGQSPRSDRQSKLQQIIDNLDRSGTQHVVIDVLSLIRDQLSHATSDSAIVPFDRVGLVVKHLRDHFRIVHKGYGYTNVFARLTLEPKAQEG
jgi:hypothetical protein